MGGGEGAAASFQPTSGACRENSPGLVFNPGAPAGEGCRWSNSRACLIPEGAGGLILHKQWWEECSSQRRAAFVPNKSKQKRWPQMEAVIMTLYEGKRRLTLLVLRWTGRVPVFKSTGAACKEKALKDFSNRCTMSTFIIFTTPVGGRVHTRSDRKLQNLPSDVAKQ